jgi:hypothetical protein
VGDDPTPPPASSVRTEVLRRSIDAWAGGGAGRFDAAVSHRAFAEVRNLRRLLSTVHHHLRREGRLVFSVPHPQTTAPPQAYFDEETSPPRGTLVRHRTFETYVRDLWTCGFALEELSEGLADHGGGRSPAKSPEWVAFRCARR